MKRKYSARRKSYRSRRRTRKGSFTKRVRRVVEKNAVPQYGTGFTTAASPYYDAPILGYLNTQIIPGTSSGNRIGQQIYMRRLFLQLMPAARIAASRVRFTIGYDTQHNGTSISPTQMQAFLFTAVSTPIAYCSPFRPDLVGPGKRFRILWDKLMDLNIGGGAVDAPYKHLIRKRWNLKGRSVIFNNQSNGDDRDCDKYALFLFTTSDQQSTTFNAPVFDLEYQLQWSNSR